MRVFMTRVLPLLTVVGVAGFWLVVAFPLTGAAQGEGLQTPTGDLESCVEVTYQHFTQADSGLVLTTEYRNKCDVDLAGGRVRLLTFDGTGQLVEDGWSQIPELPAGAVRTDDTLFQKDLSEVARMGHADLRVWRG